MVMAMGHDGSALNRRYQVYHDNVTRRTPKRRELKEANKCIDEVVDEE